MKKFNSILDKAEEYSAAVLFMIMSVTVLVAIICRFVIKLPFPWGEELARYCMIYGVFIGISIGIRKKAHLGVEAFVGFLPKGAQKYAEMVSQILTFVIMVILFVLSIQITINIKGTGQQTPAMMIPMYLAYMAMPIGFALSVIRCIGTFYHDFIKGEIDNPNSTKKEEYV